MANELAISASLAFQKGADSVSAGKSGVKLTVAGTEYTELIQTIGLTEEALLLGDIGTPGYAFIENLDTTNFVSIRSGTGVANCIKIPAGGFAMFMFASAAPFAIADTAAVRIRSVIIEA
jgi:hypothetical protein